MRSDPLVVCTVADLWNCAASRKTVFHNGCADTLVFFSDDWGQDANIALTGRVSSTSSNYRRARRKLAVTSAISGTDQISCTTWTPSALAWLISAVNISGFLGLPTEELASYVALWLGAHGLEALSFLAPRRSSSDLFFSHWCNVHMNRRCLVVFVPVHWKTQRIVASNASSCLALPCLALSCLVLSCLVLSCLVSVKRRFVRARHVRSFCHPSIMELGSSGALDVTSTIPSRVAHRCALPCSRSSPLITLCFLQRHRAPS